MHQMSNSSKQCPKFQAVIRTCSIFHTKYHPAGRNQRPRSADILADQKGGGTDQGRAESRAENLLRERNRGRRPRQLVGGRRRRRRRRWARRPTKLCFSGKGAPGLFKSHVHQVRNVKV